MHTVIGSYRKLGGADSRIPGNQPGTYRKKNLKVWEDPHLRLTSDLHMLTPAFTHKCIHAHMSYVYAHTHNL